jgi:hypothetical protein
MPSTSSLSISLEGGEHDHPEHHVSPEPNYHDDQEGDHRERPRWVRMDVGVQRIPWPSRERGLLAFALCSGRSRLRGSPTNPM